MSDHHRGVTMMWVIRGTDVRKGQDFAFVVEAGTQAAVELWAMRRGVPVEIIHPAEDDDIELARRANRLWRSTPAPRYFCFDRLMALRDVAGPMIAGVLTAWSSFAQRVLSASHSRRKPNRGQAKESRHL